MFKNKCLSYFTALAAVFSVVAIPFASNAQSFPERSLRWLVPTPAGSSADIVTRFVKAERGLWGNVAAKKMGLRPS